MHFSIWCINTLSSLKSFFLSVNNAYSFSVFFYNFNIFITFILFVLVGFRFWYKNLFRSYIHINFPLHPMCILLKSFYGYLYAGITRLSTQRPFHKVQVLNQTKRHQHLYFLGLTVSISSPFPFMKTRPFYYIRRLQYLWLFGRDPGVSISRLPMEARTVLVKSSIFAFSGSQEFASLAFP